ncbi:MAG: hypothetical protein R3A13_03250 [Bdellovibrionota bacterium]
MSTEDQTPPVTTNSESESTAEKISGVDSSRGEIKASTVARMMGLMTVSDMTLFESKIDLITTKVNNIGVRLEKVTAAINSVPAGSDLDRIEAQLASLRTLLKEFMGVSANSTNGTEAAKEKRERAVISSSTEGVREKAKEVLDAESEVTKGAAEESADSAT